jgi:hypothetical protein
MSKFILKMGIQRLFQNDGIKHASIYDHLA